MDKECLQTNTRAVKITVKGRVQGVGFRPFIFQLAAQFVITGTVQNNMDGVKIFAEGEETALHNFVTAIRRKPPRLARIDEVLVEEDAPNGYEDFSIIPSERTGTSSLVIPVDSAVCPDCLMEMRDSENFRYHYPFINCTQCGPRYTIIDSLPYDRPFTTMKSFTMCATCEGEYNDPLNRRHHAQPIACEVCGPKLMLASMNGRVVAEKDEALIRTRDFLQQGKIVAIKGIGGYHLACNAFDDEVVSILRQRKRRPQRPLAVMAASIEIARQISHISGEEEELLTSPEAPIVILRKKKETELAESLAPGMNTIGVMLPYTPLHHLLFEQMELKVLVMTSANPSGLPMLYQEDEAVSYLSGIADYMLMNNRPILHPLDDSVVQIVRGKQVFLRRSRGYVPDPMMTEERVHGVIALGSQQKNTFAIGRNEQIFIGPHIGEMENVEIVEHHEHELAHLMKWMGIEAEKIAVDLHPTYVTTSMARHMNGQVVEVQHHHAHLVSCMEDNRLKEPVFGIILDGTGYGEDGHIWGFEFLYGDAKSYKRLAHLHYTPLPGNEKAIREPWRNAVAMLIDSFGEEGIHLAKSIFQGREYEIDILARMIENKVNSPLVGTCGRLFDAVSALLGVCEISTYDGEAAIKLSEKMTPNHGEKAYPFEVSYDGEVAILSVAPLINGIMKDRLSDVPIDKLIQRFHETIVHICVEMIADMGLRYPNFNKNIVLSGGSFHNPYLSVEIAKRLQHKGFHVFTHERVPCNDGGLSLGQLIIAANQK